MRKLLCLKPFELKIPGHGVIKKTKGKNVSNLPLDSALAKSKEFGKKYTNLNNISKSVLCSKIKNIVSMHFFEIFQTKPYYTVQNSNLRLGTKRHSEQKPISLYSKVHQKF